MPFFLSYLVFEIISVLDLTLKSEYTSFPFLLTFLKTRITNESFSRKDWSFTQQGVARLRRSTEVAFLTGQSPGSLRSANG